jgi:hypothetical protein
MSFILLGFATYEKFISIFSPVSITRLMVNMFTSHLHQMTQTQMVKIMMNKVMLLPMTSQL